MSEAKEYLKRVGLIQSPYISQERVIKHLEAFAKEQVEAITVTRCCKSDSELLNVSKTNPDFNEWLKTHEKFKDNTYVWGNGYILTYSEMKTKHKELIELNI